MKFFDIFLLDRTGSMINIRDNICEAHDGYITAKKESDLAENTLSTLIQFDSISTDVVYKSIPIKEVPKLNIEPRGSTPLIDACCETIYAVDAMLLNELAGTYKVSVTFMSDGLENASTKYTSNDLSSLIKERTQAGWQFVYIGANIDAYQQAAAMGIPVSSTMSFDGRERGASCSAYRGLVDSQSAWASGSAESISFSAEQKEKAGDKFYKKQTQEASSTPPTPPTPPTVKKEKNKPLIDPIDLSS